MVKTKQIEAIDLFCGVGGLSYGLKKSGIKIKAGLDNDGSCRHAYEKNTKATFIEADISSYDLTKLKKFYSKGSTKVLVGCAPCQPFSSHTHKNKGKEADKRWNLIEYFTKAVEELQPDIISMENVRGLIKTKMFDQFLDQLDQLEYKVTYEVVFCPDYGIPQNRYRLVLIGSHGSSIPIPKKTHTKDRYKTVRDTIDRLSPLPSGGTYLDDPIHRAEKLYPINIQRIKQSKPGGTWKDWNKKLLPNCYKKESGQSYRSVYGRMQWDQPSPTITTQFFNYGTGRFGHPEQDRAISIREGALLQTFPMKYDFGKMTALHRMGRHIGNAVPPRLGQVIGRSIVNHIKNETNR